MYEGVWASYPNAWPEIMASFDLKSTPLTLKTEDGSSSCYPFAEAVDEPILYTGSDSPQCARNVSHPDKVCAYKFNPLQTCHGRDYEMNTYDSKEAAELDNAVVVHRDACGVCSNAQDLGVRMALVGQSFHQVCDSSIQSLTSPSLDDIFGALETCYTGIGFTDQCATLWAHYGTTKEALCSDTCRLEAEAEYGANTTMSVMNGALPLCPLSQCLSCSADLLDEDFHALAGVWVSGHNAGMSDATAYPCNTYYPIIDPDPCQGAAPTFSPTLLPTIPPTSAPSPVPVVETVPPSQVSVAPSPVPVVETVPPSQVSVLEERDASCLWREITTK